MSQSIIILADQTDDVMRVISLASILLIVVISGRAQNRPSISLSVSNGGLIGDQLETAYYFYGTTDPSDAVKFNETTLEFALRAEIPVKERVFLALTGGYGFYRNRYDINELGAWGKSDQSFGRAGVGILYKVSIEKLQITTGLELPFYFVGAQEYENNYRNPGDDYQFYKKLAGGFATGLLSSTSLRYYLADEIFLVATLSFGPMYTSLGGDSSETRIDYVDPARTDAHSTGDNNEYNSFKVTKPDFSFGIGMTF